MKVGFACGVFDLFHAGHVLMLRECKEHCDYLIVAVNAAENYSDKINPGKRKPIFSLEERKLILENSRYVDHVLTYNSEEELLDILKSSGIQIRFLGEDYKNKPITGQDLGIEIWYTNRDHGISTTQIINRLDANK
jgi:glycerol-3-phosphate cytidylyltransferase